MRIGDTVIARAQVAELVHEKRRVRMTTICMVGDNKVMDGEAVLMVPSRPNGAEVAAAAHPSEPAGIRRGAA